MPLTAKEPEGGDFKFDPIPPGSYVAVCDMVIDLGVQKTFYKGEENNKRQVYIRWEVPDERFSWTQDGEEKEGPRIVSATYTLSLHENANLRAILESWRGKTFADEEKEGFDLFQILGKPCMIGVIHEISKNTGKAYPKVTSVLPVPKGFAVKPAELPLLRYNTEDESDQACFEQLSKRLREKILNQVAPDISPHDYLGPPVEHEHETTRDSNPDADAIADYPTSHPTDLVDGETGEVTEDKIPDFDKTSEPPF